MNYFEKFEYQQNFGSLMCAFHFFEKFFLSKVSDQVPYLQQKNNGIFGAMELNNLQTKMLIIG